MVDLAGREELMQNTNLDGMMSRKDERNAGRYTIAVIVKALDLLDLLDERGPMTLTELSGFAGINKATALRVLANLEARDYVERDDNARYHLGVRLLQLGARKAREMDLRTIARPILSRLQAEAGETVNLAVPGPDGIIYIDILESAHGLRMAASVGMRDDYHSAALGKAMLAYRPAPEIEEFLQQKRLAAKTPRTVVEADALRRDLAGVRERGYSIDDEENEIGARCVAAPIFDHRGGVIGAISVSGPTSRMAPERLTAIAGWLQAATRELSTQMGHVIPDHVADPR